MPNLKFFGILNHRRVDVRNSLISVFVRLTSTKVVHIKEGGLLGRLSKTSRGGLPYFSFQGIPYAQPPIGKRRFEPPLPVQAWSRIREALKEGPKAPSIIPGKKIDPISDESCLRHLNVYSKQVQNEGGNVKQPVLFFIHGGSFHMGSGDSDIYGPDYLVDKGVVLVTINYRLGAFGFLSLQNELCPGNNGLHDQVEALKWTQRNISAFGGDPNNITIFGSSAGGSCAQYLMLSPLTKGLFHKAICQSGLAISPWAMSRRPVEMAYALGEELGLKTSDDETLLDYLKTVPSSEIVLKTANLRRKVEPETYFSSFAFLPVVEPSLPGAFLSKNPLDMLWENGLRDVPYMLGTNQIEGPAALDPGYELKEPQSRSEWEGLLRICSHIQPNSSFADFVLEKIKGFYFKNGFTKEGYQDVLSWLILFAGYDKTLQIIGRSEKRKSKTYRYQFTYEGNLSYLKPIFGYSDWKGTFHADEIPYIFSGSKFSPAVPGSNDDKMIDLMTSLLTDFAKTGEPTPGSGAWKPYTIDKEEYMEINSNLMPRKKFQPEEVEFWNSIFKGRENFAQ